MMLEGAGFNMIDLGVDVSIDTTLASAREHQAGYVLLSALLTTTMLSMRETVESVKQAEPDLKVIIGGGPPSTTETPSV
ncbi:MAG: hypothetical protein CL393_07825 [Acidiferrobacteraceae bacterium]|nr:hypothetical protein [Acidiferrobacteraceae bacterium]